MAVTFRLSSLFLRRPERINAIANLVILIALGVDFPVVWCFFYFFLHFIPNVGFLIS